MRIGLKLGVPNIVGLNFEYATPALNNKLAAALDFSFIPITIADVDLKFTYFELGANYYFVKEGKGPYGHFSYGRIGFDGTYTDDTYGEGTAKVGFSLLNFKLGAKFGNGFYFRPEIGYATLLGGSTEC
ncbi:MAG: hypothetical protein O2951_05885 [Bacteroidetes bacterium]|nr:hypothetical protein [Bacteroidota bacterium]